MHRNGCRVRCIVDSFVSVQGCAQPPRGLVAVVVEDRLLADLDGLDHRLGKPGISGHSLVRIPLVLGLPQLTGDQNCQLDVAAVNRRFRTNRASGLPDLAPDARVQTPAIERPTDLSIGHRLSPLDHLVVELSLFRCHLCSCARRQSAHGASLPWDLDASPKRFERGRAEGEASSHIHQWPTPARWTTCAPARSAVSCAISSVPT